MTKQLAQIGDTVLTPDNALGRVTGCTMAAQTARYDEVLVTLFVPGSETQLSRAIARWRRGQLVVRRRAAP